MDIDLSGLTLLQVFGFAGLITFLDVAAAYLLAVIHGNFSLSVVAVWLQSHTIKRVFPIFALAVVGSGIPTFNIPPIGPAFLMAIAGLTAYAIETIKSITVSFTDTTPPIDTTPVPSP